MKTIDLRINNLVKCKISNDAAYYRIVAINGFDGIVYLDGARHKEKIPIEKIKPIPLTEEILLKCGFEKVPTTLDIPVYEINFMPRFIIEKLIPLSDHFTLRYNDFISKRRGESILICNIKYLHQLQNLIFCLTGEELEAEL